jgi:hypothetical protein
VQKKIGDIQLLNLLVHHPEAVSHLMNSDCMTLLSDEAASKIVEVIFEKYRREGRFSSENLEEDIDSEDVRIRLREVIVADSIYSDQEVKQAVEEIREKARQKKFADSVRNVKGDPEALNDLLLKLRAQVSC